LEQLLVANASQSTIISSTRNPQQIRSPNIKLKQRGARYEANYYKKDPPGKI
jgi:hypothetical protein